MLKCDVVRIYDDFGEWFSEGKITAVTNDGVVTVDFLDWIQEFKLAELNFEVILYKDVYTTSQKTGKIVNDFR